MNDCKTRSGRAFDRQAWTYDTARFGSHARGLYPVLLEQLVQIPHGSVLDVGCGTGELLREVGLRFPETARTGLDLSANMLAVARERLAEKNADAQAAELSPEKDTQPSDAAVPV